MKTYGGSVGTAPYILNFGTGWRWVVSFTPRLFCPGERIPSSNYKGGCVGLRAGLNVVEKYPLTPAVQPMA
jgi:hypothetical protein